MNTREETVQFIQSQFIDITHPGYTETNKQCRYHYGKYELTKLLDFIYGGEPENDKQKIEVSTYSTREKERWLAKKKLG